MSNWNFYIYFYALDVYLLYIAVNEREKGKWVYDRFVAAPLSLMVVPIESSSVKLIITIHILWTLYFLK